MGDGHFLKGHIVGDPHCTMPLLRSGHADHNKNEPPPCRNKMRFREVDLDEMPLESFNGTVFVGMIHSAIPRLTPARDQHAKPVSLGST